MVEKVLYGQMAEAMLIGIPALTIVITFMVQIGMCLVNKVRQVREDGKTKNSSRIILSYVNAILR